MLRDTEKTVSFKLNNLLASWKWGKHMEKLSEEEKMMLLGKVMEITSKTTFATDF